MSGYLGTEIKRNVANTAVRFREIPVCKYNLSIFDEKRIYTTKDFLRIYRDMVLIREFEIMLLSLKMNGVYRGVAHSLKTPIAIEVGREALSVGEAYCAEPFDDMLSSENNIADLLAKGLSAIEKMTESDLAQIMQGYHKGKVLMPLSAITDKNANVKDVAVNFLIYGLLSEIFEKTTGFCFGFRGSKNVYFKPFGVYPCNMIESDAAGLALGVALYHKNSGADGCVIANMDANTTLDGRMWETLCLAESGTLRTKKNAGLPILFTLIRGREADESETSIRKCTARICAGIGSNMMYAETVNASDPLAVIDAVSRKKEILKRGEGAALLEMVCDQLQENPKGIDPVKLYREKLIRHGIASESDLKALEEHISMRMEKICRLSADDEKSPPSPALNGEEDVFVRTEECGNAVRKIMPEVKIPQKNCKRWQAIQKKYDKNSEGTDSYTISDALFEPIFDMLYREPDFIVCSMNSNDEVLSGLSDAMESNRFLRSLSSEAAMVSCALGYVLRGGRAIVSLNRAESFTIIADILTCQIAKCHLSGESIPVPLILRVPMENQLQNSETLLSLASSISGFKVVYPVTPYEAKGLMAAALKEENPIIFFEPKNLYNMDEKFEENAEQKEAYELQFGKPSLKRKGSDITILSVGVSLYSADKAASLLAEMHGVEAEILHAQTIVPFDYETVLKSIEKTGKLLIVGEGSERGSVMRDFAAVIGEMAFDLLDAPVIAMGTKTEADIVHMIHQKIIPLEGNMK